VIDSTLIDGLRINLFTVVSISSALSDHETQFSGLEKMFINSEFSLIYRSHYINKDFMENCIDIIKNYT
jgi:hypothetical protein